MSKTLSGVLVPRIISADFPSRVKPQKTLSGTQKEITSQTDWYLVSLSSKIYVFEDKLTKSVWLIISFSVSMIAYS